MKEISTVDQLSIAKIIAEEMPHLTLSEVQTVIQREQELTMDAIKNGSKVVKKNYLTIYPLVVKERLMISPLNGGKYVIPKHRAVGVKVGEGFKAMVAGKDMPSKICRSVAKSVA